MQYKYADITITPFSETAVDILSAVLGEIGFDSFEETETGTKAYILEDMLNEEALADTIDNFLLPSVQIDYTIHDLENKDWNTQWEHEHFDPILEREFGIKLNPRMAFGSGSHETTYQITCLLISMDFTGQRVLDMGTGTGVLAIAMAMAGAKEIVAIDVDEFSVENAKENFLLNSIEAMESVSKVEILLGDASAIEGSFDTIVANIHKNILKADIHTYVDHLSSNGTIIFSGFYHDDIPEMVEAAERHNLALVSTHEKNDWVVLLFKKNL